MSLILKLLGVRAKRKPWTGILRRKAEKDPQHAVELFDTIALPRAPQRWLDVFRPIVDFCYRLPLALCRQKLKGKTAKQKKEVANWLLLHLEMDPVGQVALRLRI